MNKSQLNKMRKKLDPKIKEQVITIFKIEKAMRKKVEEQIEIFEEQPAAQVVTSTKGERILKANPAIQEIRALFRDYVAIAKAEHDILNAENISSDEPKNTLELILKRRRDFIINQDEENKNAIDL